MKILLIGGTGTISMAISKQLLEEGHDLYLVNRGNRNDNLPRNNVHHITCDINNEDKMSTLLEGHTFDVVAEFIAFTPEQLERDYRLFKGITQQFVFISSASAYQKPLSDYRINEGTPLSNPYWSYSRNKIACEAYLMDLYRDEGFPVTIVRPSHTYDERNIPLGVHGSKGSWQVAQRILEGKPVIVHGDGTSLWTMTHNSDFANGFIGLLGNRHAIGEAVNVVSEESLTWNQIYMAIGNALGKEVKIIHVPSDFLAATSDNDFLGGLIGDKANTVVFDTTKLKRLVPGFVAKTRFDQGIRLTVKNVLEHKELQVLDEEFDHYCDQVVQVFEDAVRKLQTAT